MLRGFSFEAVIFKSCPNQLRIFETNHGKIPKNDEKCSNWIRKQTLFEIAPELRKIVPELRKIVPELRSEFSPSGCKSCPKPKTDRFVFVKVRSFVRIYEFDQVGQKIIRSPFGLDEIHQDWRDFSLGHATN